jgi:hypothetical protein
MFETKIMKFEALVTILMLLTVGCFESQSDRAIAMKIDKLYKKANQNPKDWSWIDARIEGHLHDLKSRGYFERKEVILDIIPNTAEWTNVSNQAMAFMKTRDGKGITLEIGPNLVVDENLLPNITKGLSIVIWDRPSSMSEWAELIEIIKKDYQCMELSRRTAYVIDDMGHPIEGAYIVGHQQMEKGEKQVITLTDEYGYAAIWGSGLVIMEVGKKPYYPQHTASSSRTNITINLNSEIQERMSLVEGDISDAKQCERDKSPLWGEWINYLQWLEQSKNFSNEKLEPTVKTPVE